MPSVAQSFLKGNSAGGVPPSLPALGADGTAAAAAPVGSPRPPGGGDSYLETIGNKSTTSPKTQRDYETEQRVRRRRDVGKLISVLRELGLDSDALGVRQCGQVWKYKCDNCDGAAYKRLRGISCHHPLCAYCLHDRAARLAAEWAPVLAWLFTYPAHMTLTLRRYPDESLEAMDARFLEAFGKLIRSREWKRHVKGGVLNLEIAHSDAGWGVHGHLLVDCQWWNELELSALWLSITGDSTSVKIKRVSAEPGGLRDAIAEVIKYPVKLADILDRPELVGELVDYLAGPGKHRRAFRAFGSAVGALKRYREHIASEKGITLDELEASEREAERLETERLEALADTCPHCGAAGCMRIVPAQVLPRWETVALNDVWYGVGPPLPGG